MRRVFTRRLREQLVASVALLMVCTVLCGHNLYIKMTSYFLKPGQEATLSLYNGTFERSENILARDRMLDASVVSHGQRTAIAPGQWTDRDTTVTELAFRAGEQGTYVVGVSTKPKDIALAADQFNEYLQHDGVLDLLEQRKADGSLDQDAVESYQKHVKAIYQVGKSTSDDWGTVLGYPIEFVPMANPYEKYSGQTLDVQLLLDGKPLPNQLVYAHRLKPASAHAHHDHSHGHSHDHSHDHADQHGHQQEASDEGHRHPSGDQLRTNDQGIVSVNLPEDGIYYLRTIHMESVTDSEELTHRSKWATLAFEVTHSHHSHAHDHGHDHGHSHGHDHGHDHHHEHEEAIPTWVFVLVSALIIAILFRFFRKKDG